MLEIEAQKKDDELRKHGFFNQRTKEGKDTTRMQRDLVRAGLYDDVYGNSNDVEKKIRLT